MNAYSKSFMDLSMNLNNICRICLDKVPEHTDLFSNIEESENILEKIKICFQIILNSEKYLPCGICKKCIEDLNSANIFRIKCLTINERFKMYYENLIKINNENDTDLPTTGLDDDDNSNVVTESNDSPIFKCGKCNKVLKTKKSLENHIVSMHENKRHLGKVTGYGASRQYHCTSCSYSTPHSQTLVNHMRRHNGERPFKCHCGKTFTQASGLAAHSKTHSDITYFTCSQCGKQFKHAFSLKTHLQVHTDGNFKCNICSKLLKSKESLHAHIRRHCKVFNYNCEDCGDTFITSAELINHKRKHSKIKSIACSFCDYTTNTKTNITVHLKRHMGDKAYSCNYCTKSFHTQSDLKRHNLVHTKEKAFSCEKCSQKFTYSSSLNKHMLIVHGINYKWRDVKLKESRSQNVPISN